MRAERRRRTLAAIAVIATVAGTAYAQLAITSSPAPTNGAIPANTVGTIVFSIRNTSGGSLDITGFTAVGGTGCTGVTIGRIDMPGTQAVTLGANQQQQFIAQAANGFAASPADCTWNITTPAGTAATVTTSFVVGTGTGADVQPTVMSFGSQVMPASEVQTLLVTNYGSAAPAWASISNTTSSKFSFTGTCTGTTCSCTGTSCSFMLPSPPGSASLDVKCEPMFAGDFTQATLDVYTMTAVGSGVLAAGSSTGSAYLGTTTLKCDAYGNTIQITNAPITITTTLNQVGMGSADIGSMLGSGVLSNAQIISGDPSFKITDCGGTSCTYPDVVLPTSITIECVGTATQTSATLIVSGTNSGSDTANVTCVSMGSGPILDVSPTTADLGMQDVGASATAFVAVKNSGGSPLTNIIVTPPATNASDWTVSACPAATPCSLGAGQSMMVPISFTPTAHGDRASSFTVSADLNTPVTVTLLGTGLGAVMAITEPSGPPYDIDFGIIPRGQPFTRTLTVTNNGNKSLVAMAGGQTAPYTLAPATSQTIFPLSPQDYTVTCESATASASNDQTLSISSDAYMDGSASVSLHCAIADTAIQVTPQQFDFGEVRTGTPAQTLTATITNPATAGVAAHISSIALHEPRTGLSLTPAMTDTTLQPGSSVTVSLVLTTAVDSDLTGEFLDISVDATMLSLPVTGKVVTAKSRIVPADSLDLGTACVGTQVSGDVMLINEGTATLAVSAPTIGAGFLAAGPPGTMFPSSLAPMTSMTTSVSPAMTAAGPLSTTLTWADDTTTYMLPVKLDYVSSGTAISPAQLDFGSVAVDASALPQHITIENCDLTPTTVSIKSITTKNSPVGAWVLEPRLGYTKTLPAHEKQAVTVTFRPPGRGRYEADLDVETSIGTKRIHLIGDATGRDFDRTSFYACACETRGPTSPMHGWPIAAAIVIIIVRRRRGSSSAR